MKTVFITGGSRGIGAAAVRKFHKEGYAVVFGYNKAENEALALADELGVAAIKGDLSDAADTERLCEEALKALGHIDVLVLNAGAALPQKLLTDTSLSEWDRLFDINVRSMFLCLKTLLPSMISRHSGSIVTVSSMWGEVGASCEAAYSASKAAVIGLTKATAKEVGPSGIRVNCVSPGVIATDMNSHLSADDMQTLCDETALCAIGSAEQAADAIYMFASEQSSFITGQVLGVNGGFVI